jgi:ArsR family transcriptional regulator, virulence genes transcriptional regulator
MPTDASALSTPPSLERMQAHADEAIAVLKAMASRNRLMLLCQLVQGERSVGELAQALDLAQSVVSQHLSLLRRDGVVHGRREAQSIYYRISDPRVQALMRTMFEQFCADD